MPPTAVTRTYLVFKMAPYICCSKNTSSLCRQSILHKWHLWHNEWHDSVTSLHHNEYQLKTGFYHMMLSRAWYDYGKSSICLWLTLVYNDHIVLNLFENNYTKINLGYSLPGCKEAPIWHLFQGIILKFQVTRNIVVLVHWTTSDQQLGHHIIYNYIEQRRFVYYHHTGPILACIRRLLSDHVVIWNRGPTQTCMVRCECIWYNAVISDSHCEYDDEY